MQEQLVSRQAFEHDTRLAVQAIWENSGVGAIRTNLIFRLCRLNCYIPRFEARSCGAGVHSHGRSV